MALPACVVLFQQSENGGVKYLRPTDDDDESSVVVGKTCVKFSECPVGTYCPRVKFAVEYVEGREDGGVAHIRHCYTNKYLTKGLHSDSFIYATTKEPVDSPKGLESTLFRPKVYDDHTVEFFHVATESVVFAAAKYIDYSTVVKLPRLVAFKGDNNKYLRTRKLPMIQQLNMFFFNKLPMFEGGDFKEQACNFEIIPLSNGDICIKDRGEGDWGYFYGDSYFMNNSIWGPKRHFVAVDATSNTSSNIYHFEVVKADLEEKSSAIALRPRINDRFCERVSLRGYEFLEATSNTITDRAKLEVMEPVLSRSIEVKEYRINDAHIKKTSNTPIPYRSNPILNPHNEVVKGATLRFSKEITTSTTFTHSYSFTTYVKTTFDAGIPYIKNIVDGKVHYESTTQKTHDITWGSSVQVTTEWTSEIPVDINPRSKAFLSVSEVITTYEIPFSYIQTDLLTNGKIEITEHDDGILKGSQPAYEVTPMSEPL